MERVFEDFEATRDIVPVLLGIVGPSGSGKTYTALELATGIQSIYGGEIGLIDTESKRAKHYADIFKFRHLDFKPPFDSLSYLSALEHFYKKGIKTIIVDSMSHEHEGDGGVLSMHEDELDRLTKGEEGKRERMSMLAWGKPKKYRRELINGILQMGINGIFCFRAKEKIKMVRGQDPIKLGWQPIAGEEFVFEMTANIFLPPNSNGIPNWNPDEPAARQMIKLPLQFRGELNDNKPLSREHGIKIANWAMGFDVIITKYKKEINDCTSVESLSKIGEEIKKQHRHIQKTIFNIYDQKRILLTSQSAGTTNAN